MIFPQLRNFPEHAAKKTLKASNGITEGVLSLPPSQLFCDPFLCVRSNPLSTCCWRTCSGDEVYGLYLLQQRTFCYSRKRKSHQNGWGGAACYALPTPEMWDLLLQMPLGRGGSWVCPHADCNYWAYVWIRIFLPAPFLWNYLVSLFLLFLWGKKKKKRLKPFVLNVWFSVKPYSPHLPPFCDNCLFALTNKK